MSLALALGTTFLTHAGYAQAQADKDENANSWGAGTIVVTGRRDGYTSHEGGSATRTNTPLINVPQSVQVLNSSLIRDQDRRSLADALVNVSGVVPTKPEESALAQPLIRGFAAEIFQDGLPAYTINAMADPTSLIGVERVEVVKGPTSTVYGGGAGAPLGGLINVVSVRPQDKFAGYVAIRGGSWSTYNPYADINVPLSDNIAARVTAEYQHNESWIDKAKGYRWSIQPSLSFKLGDQTQLLLQGRYDRRSQLEYSGLPAAQAQSGQIDRYAFPGAPVGQPRSTIVNKLVSGEFRHEFSDDVRLTVTGRYFYNNYDEYGSFVSPDYGQPDPVGQPTTYYIFPIFLPNRVKEATADANLLVNKEMLGGQHELLVGANYDHTRNTIAMYFNFSPLGTFVPIGEIDLANPVYNNAFGPTPAFLQGQTDKFETTAAYVQDQATYGPLHLSGSLRYTHLKWRRVGAIDATYNHFNPRVGATFDIKPGVALFAGYATGFRGAFSFFGADKPKPETSTSLEGGLKLALPKAGLWGTIAAYKLTRQNVAVPDPEQGFLAAVQVGEQRSRGFEADITWEPIRALSILANYAYTDAEVTKDVPPSPPLTVSPLVGNRLARVPKHSGRIAAHYRVLNGPLHGLSFGAGVTAFSSRETWLPTVAAGGGTVPGYAVIDAQASYDFGRYTITVSGMNLGGKRGFDTYEYLSPVVAPIQPRSGYVMLKARF
ncbi:TonB-dependent siderophore receptor [Sphingobium amiense]|uniref:TonB-dependent siderophore receptor n=1 Tax=Sphingobium amiense TaxID=135719 RepID=A0A494W9W4_9SPHN|nr:TonB-dependent siderophore receptor [Sphingobium amiense]BBD97225.1 TonB-dependent siderophore receptor [Sphingobium amiense]